ncbi:MAG: hypothetical protein HYV13_01130 [Candidatus Doudnabacteria bacterium]|nr:hypothetical protein [Candidatus Doudnabacteria bacterium]
MERVKILSDISEAELSAAIEAHSRATGTRIDVVRQMVERKQLVPIAVGSGKLMLGVAGKERTMSEQEKKLEIGPHIVWLKISDEPRKDEEYRCWWCWKKGTYAELSNDTECKEYEGPPGSATGYEW